MRAIKQFIRRVKRTYAFLPIIWKGYDWDYGYAIELFRYQLERTADFLESDRAVTMDAHLHAQKIRTAVRLIDMVYGDEMISFERWKKAERILWKFISHNIKHWWD